MDQNDRIKELIKLAKKHGLKTIKADGIELEFHDTPPQPKARRIPKDQPVVVLARDGGFEKTERMPTDDELLFWSTDSYDTLIEQRSKKEVN